MKKKSRALVLSVLFCFLFSAEIFSQTKTASQLYEQGLEAQNEENWYEASQYFMEAIQSNSVYGDAWFHLAQCSYQLGEYDLVLLQLEEAEKFAKNDSSINNLKGMTYIALCRFNDARKIFESIIKELPNDVEARFGLAELDLFEGRITGAEKQYVEALKRQAQNRKALLSLALVSSQLGKVENARKYINQALQYYSDEAEVHYVAAVIHAMQGDFKSAEMRCRVAVEVKGDYDKAYELLTKLRYAQKDTEEVIAICDYRIGRDRKCASAWYLKGCAQSLKGELESAIQTWTTGLRIVPEDETMRSALELAVKAIVPLEDNRRPEWASYHIRKARECSRRYDSAGTTFEYQRALKIQPDNEEARMNFASTLELNGMHELYLDQLLFVDAIRTGEKQQTLKQQMMDDTIEAYEDLLQDSLAKKWGVQPFYLDKTRWNIGVYYYAGSVNAMHIEANRIAAEYACDIFGGIASTAVSTKPFEIKSFGQAYQKARTEKMDYFVILSVDEGSRDITLTYTLYCGRTGSKIAENSLYATGNEKYSSVFRRFRRDVLEKLTVRGKIIDRQGKTLLADIGKSENLVEGAVFEIIKKDSIQTASSGAGIIYNSDSVLGTFTVTTCGEEISEGILEYKGFYDRINIDDEIVLISMPQKDAQAAGGDVPQAADNAPLADVNGEPVTGKRSLTAEDLGARRTPSLVELIRSIY